MAKGDDIEERLLRFAVGVARLCSSLPRSAVGLHIAGQLLRSGTAPAPNYAEARAAESPRDFSHKLGIAAKELYESRMWLRILAELHLAPDPVTARLFRESDELCRIFATSRRTLNARLRSSP